MSDDIVKQARELASKATPGPWRADRFDDSSRIYRGNPLYGRLVAILPYEHNPRDEEDAALIAAAPSLLPALADRVEQLEQAAREVLAAYDAIYAGGHGDGRATRHQDALAALRKAVG